MFWVNCMEKNALSVQLLDNHFDGVMDDNLSERIERGRRIEGILCSSGAKVLFEGVYTNPASEGYNFLPSEDTTLDMVRACKDKIAAHFRTDKVRIFSFNHKILIEIPAKHRRFPSLKDIFSFEEMNQGIPFILGEGENGKLFIEDIRNVENLLVGGSDKKEVLSLAEIFLTTLLYRRSEEKVKVILIGETFKPFEGIPHLIDSVVTEKSDIIKTMMSLRSEMYQRIDRCYSAGVGNIQVYNHIMRDQAVPEIVILVDKLGRAIDEIGPAITQFVSDLTLRGRYAGIYMIGFVNTARLMRYPVKLPNIMHRIALHTDTVEESVLLLGDEGADALCGEGDMLISGFSSSPRRIQSPMLTESDIKRVLREVKNNSVFGLWEKDDAFINL